MTPVVLRIQCCGSLHQPGHGTCWPFPKQPLHAAARCTIVPLVQLILYPSWPTKRPVFRWAHDLAFLMICVEMGWSRLIADQAASGHVPDAVRDLLLSSSILQCTASFKPSTEWYICLTRPDVKLQIAANFLGSGRIDWLLSCCRWLDPAFSLGRLAGMARSLRRLHDKCSQTLSIQ